MRLSPEAQKIYDNSINTTKIEVNGQTLNMAPMCSYVSATSVELLQNENILKQRIEELKNKMLYIFNEGVRLGFLEHGVMAQASCQQLMSLDLTEKYAVYLFPYSRYSAQTLNENFGLNGFTERYFVLEGEIGPKEAWDKLQLPND